MNLAKKETAVLLVTCPDQKGLVAAISTFLLERNANILHADQHQDPECGLFLMRVEWDLSDFRLSSEQFFNEFEPIASRFYMKWRLAYSQTRQNVAILVSKYDHCLVDLLYRQRSGEFNCDIPIIISNHPNTRQLADFFNI